MNLSFFIAKRLIGKSEHRFSRPVMRVAILAVSLSIAVMLISIATISGFQNEIRDKVIGYGSHIQVTHFSKDNSFESKILPNSSELKNKISKIDGVVDVQKFATKAGLIKTDEEIYGIVLKGVDQNYSFSFFENYLLDGEIPIYNSEKISNEIIISSTIASKLKMKVGDTFTTYFIQKPTRARKFSISAIYDSGLSEFDDLYIVGDLKHIQKLNKWSKNQCGGLEIKSSSIEKLSETTKLINGEIGYDLIAQNITDLNPQLFNWLKLQDINVIIIIVLMMLVALINITTLLFILILERIQMIGILKSMGLSDWGIRKIFLYFTNYIMTRGLLFGNVFALTLLLIQKVFKVVKLDQATYYMSEVPIHFDLKDILLLNLGTITISFIVLIIPTYLVSKIRPIKTIRFE
ncbi:MAG: ABC transporter permease [Flavobacteriales bacterium]